MPQLNELSETYQQNLQQAIAYLSMIGEATDIQNIDALSKSELRKILANVANLSTEGSVYAGLYLDYKIEKQPEYDVPVVHINGFDEEQLTER